MKREIRLKTNNTSRAEPEPPPETPEEIPEVNQVVAEEAEVLAELPDQ